MLTSCGRRRSCFSVALVLLLGAVLLTPLIVRAQAGKPAPGESRWGLPVPLAARWLDPAETEAFSTPFMVMYAVHDAMLKPMPAGLITPSLAESWTEAKDHLSYTFVLRKGVRFHNGDPVTAEDVKFSWDRYKGASAKLLKDKVKEVQVLTALRSASSFASRGPTSSPSTGPRPPARGGSCRRGTWRRWARTASRPRPSARDPTRSCPSSRGWSWCWKPSTATGARRRR